METRADGRRDIAVVGGGVAGLAAAIEAAGTGASVTLHDARETLGGRARTREVGGFLLNEGAHALYVDGAAMAFLRMLGREPAGGVPDPTGGVGVDGRLVGSLPAGPWSVLRTPLLRGDRLAFGRVFARLARLEPLDFRDVTVTDAVRGLVGDGPASRVVHALFRLATYGNDPDVASADTGIAQLVLGLGNGVRYLDGGWRTIVDALLDEARRRGVRVEPGAKVTAVAPVPGGVEVVTTARRRRHDAVVLAPGAPRHVAALLGDRVPDAARWAATARASGVASFDVGLAGPWGSGPTFALGLDTPMYLSVHAPVARLAPEGRTLVNVSRYLPPDETPDPDRDRRACEEFLERIRPGWRDDACHVEFHPRLVASTDQPRAAEGGMTARPASTVPGLAGVYVAGDWVGPVGSLADASVASGRAAARLAVAGKVAA